MGPNILGLKDPGFLNRFLHLFFRQVLAMLPLRIESLSSWGAGSRRFRVLFSGRACLG